MTKRIESASKPHWVVITPDGRKAYTCNKTQPFISVLDLQQEKMIKKIDVPSTEEPGMSPDGKHVYFPTPSLTFGVNPPDAAIKVISTATDEIVASIPTGQGAQSVYITPLNQIMVAKYSFAPESTAEAPRPGGATLALCEAGEGGYELKGEVAIGHSLTIRSSGDGKVGFAAEIFEGRVAVVDLLAMRVVGRVDVDLEKREGKERLLGAHGMVVLP